MGRENGNTRGNGRGNSKSGAGRHTKRDESRGGYDEGRDGRDYHAENEKRARDERGGDTRRPDLRLTFKLGEGRDDEDWHPLAAFWVEEGTGYLKGGLDARVKKITVEMNDGRKFSAKPGEAGVYLNAYDSRVGNGE